MREYKLGGAGSRLNGAGNKGISNSARVLQELRDKGPWKRLVMFHWHLTGLGHLPVFS